MAKKTAAAKLRRSHIIRPEPVKNNIPKKEDARHIYMQKPPTSAEKNKGSKLAAELAKQFNTSPKRIREIWNGILYTELTESLWDAAMVEKVREDVIKLQIRRKKRRQFA